MTSLPAEIAFFKVEQVIEIHDSLLLPGEKRGLLHPAELESAVASPYAGGFDGYYNATLFEMAAALAIGLVCNHPFVDGNKRTAMVCCVLFLKFNNVKCTLGNKRLSDLLVAIAEHKFSKADLAQLLRKKSVPRRYDGTMTHVPNPNHGHQSTRRTTASSRRKTQ